MPERGEVWQVDFGSIQKVHSTFIISTPYVNTGRPLIGIIPHPTATRGLMDN